MTTVDSDPFGLFRRRRHHRLVTPVLVLPRRLDAVAVAAADIGRSAESLRPSRRSGQGDDDVVARPYVVGDEVKRVHWKATARRGELMVRQEEDREHARLVVVLDHEATVHQTTQDEFGRWTVSPSLEWCVSAAATIVHEWSDRGVDIDIVGLGGFECFAHEGRVRHVLAEVEPVRDQGRTTLPAVVRTHVVVLTGSLEEHDAMALRTAIVGDWVTVFHGPSSPEAVARLEQFGWALVLREDS